MTIIPCDPNYREITPRPTSVTLLALGVISIAIFNLIGFYQVLVTSDFLSSILPYSLGLHGLIKLLIGVGGMIISWGLWIGRSWAPKLTLLACLVYVIYFWFDRLFLQNFGGRTANIAFLVGITIISILLVFWVLANPRVKNYFGVTHEQSAER
jgi:hypothetical protein